MANLLNLSPAERHLVAMMRDPLKLGKVLWPEVSFYDKEREIIYSIRDNDETFVGAANMMGKDFVAGFICLTFFLVPEAYQPTTEGSSPTECRVVTTSVKDDHLRVLWGEIGRFIQTARTDTPLGPLLQKEGGPLVVNHRDVRKWVGGKEDKISYLRGMVSEKGEGMAGHHASHTLGVGDEASGIDNLVYTQMDTWARKKFFFGNCNPCPKTHFFRAALKAGDLLAEAS